MKRKRLSARQRVQTALEHQQPDSVPCDYFATPEIHQALLMHFGLKRDGELRARLGTDIRYVNPPYIGPELPRYPDGSFMTLWGVRRRPMANEYGDYAEPVDFPYAAWTGVEQAAAFSWPDPDWFDYQAVPALCAEYPDEAVTTGDFSVQDFINGVAFGRGVEQTLLDIALEDPVYLYIVERRHRFYMELIERSLRAAKGRIDLVLCGDDFGSQRGLLISPASFEKLFAPKKKELFDMVHGYGARISHHCCGSSFPLIPRFVELGMDCLQTIQPQAEGMNPYSLKREFGGRIVLHGGVDVQGWLQQASIAEIDAEVKRLLEEVGAGGGFILAPCHNLQPDIPLRNVLALYEAVSRFRS